LIFIDSNIPMYLVGAAHALKDDARRLLERSIAAGERLVTDAEVFQEILHRYVAIRRPDAIDPAFAALTAVVDDVLDITLKDVQAARAELRRGEGLSSRDALHVAVMRHHGVSRILTFDGGFDRVEGVQRVI
jgi:predicted nucleic acid-binding protein